MSDVQNPAAENTEETKANESTAVKQDTAETAVVMANVKFNFKQRKILDDKGEEIGKAKKQPSLTVSLPVPTRVALIAALEDTSADPVKVKIRQLILESVLQLVKDQAKSQLDEVIDGFGSDDTKTVTASDIDFDKLSLEYIAQIPPSQRGAKAIPEEDWNNFFQDYVPTMIAVTGKPEDKIKKHIEIFKKPTKIKQNKDILAVLIDQINIYLASSKSLEDTGECASRLLNRFVKWNEADESYDPDAL